MDEELGLAKIARLLRSYTFNVFPYEGIVHDVTVICLQNLLKFSDVVILIGTSSEKESMCTVLQFSQLGKKTDNRI